MNSLDFSRKVLLLFFATVQLAHSQAEFLPISELSFKDQNLASCVAETAQSHNWTTVAPLGKLHCSGRNISSTEGIEQLVALSTLNLSANSLSSIDVSRNTQLRFLYLQDNYFTEIDLSQSPKLWVLDLHSNQLTDIDLSGNSNLQFLYLNDNFLESIDISSNTDLVSLNLQTNDLTEIDVSQNTELVELKIFSNALSSIDLSTNVSLQSLDLHENQLQELHVTSNPLLKQLYVQSNALTSFNVENNTLLLALDASKNRLSEIDVSKSPNIKVLKLAYNLLDQFSITENLALSTVELRQNNITQIDIANNDEIALLDLRENPLDTDSKEILLSNSNDIDLLLGYGSELNPDTLTIELSAVSVGDAFYRVTLALIDGDSLLFELTNGVEIANPNTDEIAVFNGSLLAVPDLEFDSEHYSVLLKLLSGDDVIRFEVISIAILQ